MRILLRLLDRWQEYRAARRRARASAAREAAEVRALFDQSEYARIWYRAQWHQEKVFREDLECQNYRLQDELGHLKSCAQMVGSLSKIDHLNRENIKLQQDLAGALDEIERLKILQADPWKHVIVPDALPKEI